MRRSFIVGGRRRAWQPRCATWRPATSWLPGCGSRRCSSAARAAGDRRARAAVRDEQQDSVWRLVSPTSAAGGRVAGRGRADEVGIDRFTKDRSSATARRLKAEMPSAAASERTRRANRAASSTRPPRRAPRPGRGGCVLPNAANSCRGAALPRRTRPPPPRWRCGHQLDTTRLVHQPGERGERTAGDGHPPAGHRAAGPSQHDRAAVERGEPGPSEASTNRAWSIAASKAPLTSAISPAIQCRPNHAMCSAGV